MKPSKQLKGGGTTSKQAKVDHGFAIGERKKGRGETLSKKRSRQIWPKGQSRPYVQVHKINPSKSSDSWMTINTHKLCQKRTLHWCSVYHFCPDDRVAAYHEKCSFEFKIPPQSFWISQISWSSFVTPLGTLSLAHFMHCCPDQQARRAEDLPSVLSFVL